MPDTLVISPDNRYDLVVKTLPQKRKNDIRIQKNIHNTIELGTPQGILTVQYRQPTRYDFVDVRVSEKGKSKTLNHQKINYEQKYIVGEYDIEILTLPRIYMTVNIEQSRLNRVLIDAPGVFKTSAFKPMIGQIFVKKENNEFEWVCNLNDNSNNNEIILQPGNYQLVYRRKDLKEASFTKTRDFKIHSNKTVTLNL